MINISQISKLSGIFEKAQSLQEQINKIEEIGDTGTGVKVTMNGRGECVRVEIEPSLVKEENQQIIEDLVTASINDAQRRIQEKRAKETSNLIGVDMPLDITNMFK